MLTKYNKLMELQAYKSRAFLIPPWSQSECHATKTTFVANVLAQWLLITALYEMKFLLI